MVSSYAHDMQLGIIIGADGRRYVFSKGDWIDTAIPPKAGIKVAFESSRSCAQKIRIAHPIA